MDKLATLDTNAASLITNPVMAEYAGLHGRFHTECFDKDGNLKWIEDYDNAVTFQGKNDMLTKYFKTGTTYSTWYCSLITAGTPGTGPTYATPSPIVEITSGNITSNLRLAMTFGAAASGVLALSAACSFGMTATVTITGNMVVAATAGSITTVGDTSATNGILYSAGTFATAKNCSSGDTLNVSYSISI